MKTNLFLLRVDMSKGQNLILNLRLKHIVPSSESNVDIQGFYLTIIFY